MIRVPALYVMALWLKDLDGDADIVVPMAPAPPFLEATGPTRSPVPEGARRPGQGPARILQRARGRLSVSSRALRAAAVPATVPPRPDGPDAWDGGEWVVAPAVPVSVLAAWLLPPLAAVEIWAPLSTPLASVVRARVEISLPWPFPWPLPSLALSLPSWRCVPGAHGGDRGRPHGLLRRCPPREGGFRRSPRTGSPTSSDERADADVIKDRRHGRRSGAGRPGRVRTARHGAERDSGQRRDAATPGRLTPRALPDRRTMDGPGRRNRSPRPPQAQALPLQIVPSPAAP